MGKKKHARGSVPVVAKIHEHWLEKVLSDVPYWSEVLGDSAFENILEGDGKLCYACGIDDDKPERAHIIPHSLGGSAKADNLFLLCGLCHKENPDTIFADMFYHYVKHRDCYLTKWFKEHYPAMVLLHKTAPPDDVMLFEAALADDRNVERLKHHVVEGFKENAGIAGGGLSLATSNAILWKSFLKVGVEVCDHTELAA